jgi:hypothetical protein
MKNRNRIRRNHRTCDCGVEIDHQEDDSSLLLVCTVSLAPHNCSTSSSTVVLQDIVEYKVA